MSNFMQVNLFAITDRASECAVHEWVVFSTAWAERWLMLQCVECGMHGVVDDPSATEWSAAFCAPSTPYRWRDETRVRVKDKGRSYVMRTGPGRQCECHVRLGVPLPGEYERVPAEITGPGRALTDVDRNDLECLCKWVAGTDLCSALFPLFIQSLHDDGRSEPTSGIKEVVERIESVHRKGMHCSPCVVARVLRDYARNAPTDS